ncbi:MAG: SemiSWEET family transporter [Treponema sp.]|uniref:SemiSWEET family transporter n=1 Tax=Treponema sp. TaxID=166 RepID=UPI003FA1D755
MSESKLKILGWMGTALSVTMYVSYIPQIINNLQGNKSVFLQPMAAAINCTIWVLYALLKDKKDYPLAAANMPGIICGLIAAITAL